VIRRYRAAHPNAALVVRRQTCEDRFELRNQSLDVRADARRALEGLRRNPLRHWSTSLSVTGGAVTSTRSTIRVSPAAFIFVSTYESESAVQMFASRSIVASRPGENGIAITSCSDSRAARYECMASSPISTESYASVCGSKDL
jgi:hypothetical protein